MFKYFFNIIIILAFCMVQTINIYCQTVHELVHNQPNQCPIKLVSASSDGNGNVEIVIVALSDCKEPKIKMYGCGKNQWYNLGDYIKKGSIMSIPFKNTNCKCDQNIQIETSNLTYQKCLDSKHKVLLTCPIEKIRIDTFIISITDTITNIINDTIIVDREKIVNKQPFCKTCSKWWKCFGECFICWFFGFLVGLYFLVRLLLIARNNKLKIPYVGTIICSHFWEFICGSFAIGFIATCPCQSAVIAILGLIIGLIIIGSDFFREEKKYVEWRTAVMIGIGFIISFFIIVGVNCS